jgi:hypothetical protein
MGLGDAISKLFGGDEEEPETTPPEETGGGILDQVSDTALGEEGDLRDTVEAAMGGLEKLAKKIPGYKGYKDKEQRREADKLLREQLARELGDQRKRLSELQVQLVSSGQIEYVDDLDRAVMKIQLLTDRVKTASYGYAGLFDAVKVKEEQLDALYEFDNRMLDYADDISMSVDTLTSAISAKEGVGEAIADLVALSEEANQTFGHRGEAVLQASGYSE